MLRARSTFWWGQRPVNEGDLVPANDPVVKGARRSLFEQPGTVQKPLAPEQRIPKAPIERATQAPGEKRNGIRIPGRANDESKEPPEGRARAKARAAAAAKAAGEPVPEDDAE